MKRLTLDQAVSDALRGSVVALGNFDGFHRGHQAVVGRAVARGHHERRPVMVATFDPHPVSHFKPDVPPFRLTSLDQRERLFAGAGADAMLVFGFDDNLAATSAEDFVALLADRVGAAGLVTGADFTFGRGRLGNAASLRQLGAARGIATEVVHAIEYDGQPVSSSRIRLALTEGRPEDATHLLSRPFAIRGTVQRGDQRGRTLGYPTANLSLSDYQRPKYGIYAVRATLADGSEHCGVASLGIRPSFDPPIELLETYIFDWSGDLYDQTIEVALLHYLRPEARFDDMEALRRAMEKDEARARDLLGAPARR
jgi:riboflavin kinase/FMN adenylyltransferase